VPGMVSVNTKCSFVALWIYNLFLLSVEDNFTLATAISNEKSFTIEQLSMNDVKHDFSLDSDGSAVISITTDMQEDSSLFIQINYNPKYLGFEAFSSDPNRGFDLQPSIVTFSCSDYGWMGSETLFSNSLVIMPPVPDLSMPFNVISLYSTFCALIIGTVINITIKKSREKVRDELSGKPRKSKKEMIKERILRIISMLSRKKNEPAKEKSD